MPEWSGPVVKVRGRYSALTRATAASRGMLPDLALPFQRGLCVIQITCIARAPMVACVAGTAGKEGRSQRIAAKVPGRPESSFGKAESTSGALRRSDGASGTFENSSGLRLS